MRGGKTIAVIGAAGFVGRALVARLAAHGNTVIAVVRNPVPFGASVICRPVGDIALIDDWASVFSRASAIVHLAGRAHAPVDAVDARWIRDQAAIAGRIAAGARDAGVERIVMLSSIKVLGGTTNDAPLTADQPPAPADAYGIAKWHIESALRSAAAGGPDLVVLRPPLIYGPGVKGNFRKLLRLVDSGAPLPFGSIDNRRSLVGIENLLDLLESVVDHPAASGGTFVLRDGQDVSTPDLLRRIARQLGRNIRLVACPPSLLVLAARATGCGGLATRLIDSLQVDDMATRGLLGWRPRVEVEEELARTCRWYRAGGIGFEPAARPAMNPLLGAGQE